MCQPQAGQHRAPVVGDNTGGWQGSGERGHIPVCPCPTSLPQVEHDPTDRQCLLPAHQEWDCLPRWHPAGSILRPQSSQVSLAQGWEHLLGWGGMGWVRASTPQSPPPQSRSKALGGLRVPRGFTSCSQGNLQGPRGVTSVPNRTHSQLGANWSRGSLGPLNTDGVPFVEGVLGPGQAAMASYSCTYLSLSCDPTEPLILVVSVW